VLYSNICISPPRTDRPATASLTPYETAAFEVLVGEEPELEAAGQGRRVVGGHAGERSLDNLVGTSLGLEAGAVELVGALYVEASHNTLQGRQLGAIYLG
jgi:hypothetical protein